MFTANSISPPPTNSDAIAAHGHHASARSGFQSRTRATTPTTIRAIVATGKRSDGRLSLSGISGRSLRPTGAGLGSRCGRGPWIAQVNIALPREPLDSPALAEFVANLEPVNALADAAPGLRLAARGRAATRPRSAPSTTSD